MKQRICFVLPNIHGEFSGGAETQCYYLAKEMLARGWEVHYIRESETQEAGEFEGIIVHSIPRQRKLLKWKNWYHLRRVMDVVRANVWYVRANISYLPLVVWHSRKTKGNSIWSFSRDSQFDSKARNIKGRVLHNLFAQLDHFAFYKALQYVDGILLQTEFQKRLLLENLRLSGTVIHNAHPIPKEVPASKENKVLWIGRLQEFKHPERFVEIAKILQDSPISFELVGDSSNNRVIDEICRRSTSLSNFQWLGGTSLKDVHRLIDSSRVLVNTSDYEGFSNTFIEAWLRGVPVVSLFVDPDNFIATQKMGYVEGDVEAAARRINNLLSDNELWQIMSNNCIRFSRNRFNITGAVDRLETFLSSLDGRDAKYRSG